MFYPEASASSLPVFSTYRPSLFVGVLNKQLYAMNSLVDEEEVKSEVHNNIIMIMACIIFVVCT